MSRVGKRQTTLARKKIPEENSRQREAEDAGAMMTDVALVEDPRSVAIPALPDAMKQAVSLLSRHRSLAVLYINCSRINKIENLCGKKSYLDIMGKIHDVITGMKGNQIRQDDLIFANNTVSDEFTIFLSGKRTDMDYCPPTWKAS